MSRPTLGQLAFKQQSAHHTIHRGAFYRHQPSGKVYEITGHCIREDDGEVLVLYRPTEFDGRPERCGYAEGPVSELVFSRPLAEFMETVEWHDGEMKRGGIRFAEVRRSEQWVNV